MQRNLRQLLLLLLLPPLLEPLQAYVHPKSNAALQLPVVAVPAETQLRPSTATRSAFLRLLRLSRPISQLILSTLHRVP